MISALSKTKLCAVVWQTYASHPFRSASRVAAGNAAGGNRLRDYDVCVVGGGIVGLATAREIVRRHPELSFCLVEKEKELCELSVHLYDFNNR